jgi:hypothetical protein
MKERKKKGRKERRKEGEKEGSKFPLRERKKVPPYESFKWVILSPISSNEFLLIPRISMLVSGSVMFRHMDSVEVKHYRLCLKEVCKSKELLHSSSVFTLHTSVYRWTVTGILNQYFKNQILIHIFLITEEKFTCMI